MKYFLRALCLFFLFAVSSLVYADTQVYFSPNGGCQGAVITEINKAQKSIDVAIYSFTSREIAQALVEAESRHIKVRIVLDKAQKNERYSKSRYLISKGLDVKYHSGPGLMHNKFAVIDGQVLLTGSFNWTASAEERNDENLLIILDKELSEKYADRFKRLWAESGEGEFTEVQSEGKE
jgi:phosphatidylserine/phosphatidylglycerophosphate/cardiolipin synthase-like enzyme